MTPTEQRRRGEQRRGDQLRRHILMSAKDVFLATGYERASMDAVAARAETSKRSLYAHFESKDKLFLAVLELVRELYLARLRTPDTYATDPVDAVVLFCGRFVQLVAWESQTRTCRLCIAEAERLPGSSGAYYEAIFDTTTRRLAEYLEASFEMADAEQVAADLLSRTALPRLIRTLLGVEEPINEVPEEEALASHVDLAAIREVVTPLLPG